MLGEATALRLLALCSLAALLISVDVCICQAAASWSNDDLPFLDRMQNATVRDTQRACGMHACMHACMRTHAQGEVCQLPNKANPCPWTAPALRHGTALAHRGLVHDCRLLLLRGPELERPIARQFACICIQPHVRTHRARDG